jgi:post-segregation antitoxin (ccd killing protein)
MAVKVLWRIKADKIYEPGEVITGLSPSDEKRLVELGAAEIVQEKTTKDIKVADDPVEIKGLHAALKIMTKKELLAYAERAGIEVSEKMKVDDIINLLLNDAREKGVDVEALTDEQLRVFGNAIGISINEDMTKEQLLDAIEAHFGVSADA